GEAAREVSETAGSRLEREGGGEVEDGPDARLRPIGLADDVVEVLAQVAIVLAELVARPLGRGADAGQRVPDAVRDGRGELPDGGEALRLGQLGLGATDHLRRSRVDQRQRALAGERLDEIEVLLRVGGSREL